MNTFLFLNIKMMTYPVVVAEWSRASTKFILVAFESPGSSPSLGTYKKIDKLTRSVGRNMNRLNQNCFKKIGLLPSLVNTPCSPLHSDVNEVANACQTTHLNGPLNR